MRGTAAAAALLALAGALAGCAPSGEGSRDGEAYVVPSVGPRDLVVDSPELRALKADAGVAPCVPGAGEAVDGGLPSAVLPCFGGGEAVDLSSLEGPLLLNFWASWCGPCREEMPLLQAFHEQYGDQVATVGVAYNELDPEGAMELVAESGVTYPLLVDTQEYLGTQEAFLALNRGLPVTTLVDASGQVVFSEAVALKSTEQLLDLVDEHLGLQR
ncbi:TlpA family protein disulfide reductase [Nocardioides sp. ChNu-153]|uniref:TlpA family protein disulfide reductase n=1 Tax=unclassified Nocardioides TaxID=2615069 RepID=UPI00240724A9|nr:MULTISPECIES: TlpA disulfide reductase family protein [unclassified Nocardioides]MDF9715768.1 TlpA family protein disulfide reductase [Nocardioides sp. ChNu-99]MDN7121873.1 TlpA family protein disulfide reductase [Nocardioides sp. ChNu-153]